AEGQGDLPKGPIAGAARRQTNGVVVTVPMVGGAVILPGHERHHRRIGDESFIAEKIFHHGSARISPAPEAGGPKAVVHKPLVNAGKLWEDYFRRKVMNEGF